MGNYGVQIKVGHSGNKGEVIYVESPITSTKQRKSKILKQLSKLEGLGEFTRMGGVDILMAIGTTGGKLNEYQSKFVRFEEQPPTKTKAVPKARGETQSKIRSMFINSFYFF
jgi:hypothetical protein